MGTNLAKLFATEHTFRSLIETWVETKTCPVVLIDYLMDHDLYAAAELVRGVCDRQDLGRHTVPGEVGNMCYLCLTSEDRDRVQDVPYAANRLHPYHTYIVTGACPSAVMINVLTEVEGP